MRCREHYKIACLRSTPHNIQGFEKPTRMAADHVTESPLNSSQPACFLLGNFSWREEYLTPANFVLLVAAGSAESLLIPFTVLLNALVIFLVWRKRYLRKLKPCVLLACLAATDLLVVAVILPLVVAGHAFRLSRAHVCLLDNITHGGVYFGCSASLYHLVVISSERYVAIKHSLRYETLVTTNRLITAVATAWTISVATTLIAFISVVVKATHAGHAETIYYAINLSCIPGSFAVTCFCQVAVFLESRRHRRHIRAHQVSGAAALKILKKDKAARTTAMIVGALLLSYAPIIVCDALTLAVRLPTEVAFATFFVTDVFLYANSLVNPIIYCMRSQDFKRALRELFGLENPAQVNPQAAGNPSTRVARRRISEVPRPSPGGKRQIAWSDRAPTCISRSHSLDLSRDLANERRNLRTNSV